MHDALDFVGGCNTFTFDSPYSSSDTISWNPQLQYSCRLRKSVEKRQLSGKTNVTIFHDTFYDNLESIFSHAEWESSLLHQKCWLIHREYESCDRSAEWILKIFSQDDSSGLLGWHEIYSEQAVISKLKEKLKIDACELPPSDFSIPLMRFRVARITPPGDESLIDSWVDICGWLHEPIGIYAVSSTNFLAKPSFPDDILPSKTKVMLYIMQNAAFRLAFPKDDQMEKWIITEESPMFADYDKVLQLKDAAKKYADNLPHYDDSNFSEE